MALVNGWFVMLGALGAVTATAPAEIVVQVVDWRGQFALLGGLSAVAALQVLLLVPDCCLPKPKLRSAFTNLSSIILTSIGSSAPRSRHAMGLDSNTSCSGLLFASVPRSSSLTHCAHCDYSERGCA